MREIKFRAWDEFKKTMFIPKKLIWWPTGLRVDGKIGLVKGNNVHHKNGKRDDNRLENLELWTTMQPAGKRPKDLLEFAKEIIKLYEK